MTKIFDWQNNINEDELKDCINTLKNGGIVIFPTETVYGIGANAYCKEAVKKIYDVKERPNEKPLSIMVPNIDEIKKYAEISDENEEKIINKFMPGPITIILKRKHDVFDYVSSGKDTIGIRIPDNNIILKILEGLNQPLVAPSANISGQPSGIDFNNILKDFNGKVDIAINGGKPKLGEGSTIVQIVDGKPIILRQGKITLNEIRKCIEE